MHRGQTLGEEKAIQTKNKEREETKQWDTCLLLTTRVKIAQFIQEETGRLKGLNQSYIVQAANLCLYDSSIRGKEMTNQIKSKYGNEFSSN